MDSPVRLTFFAVLLLSTNILSSHGIQINANGSYDVTVAIHHDDTLPEGISVTTYVDNIKAVFASLSLRMWMATEETFWINSIEVIIPPSWDIPDVAEEFTWGSYRSSDVRISNSTQAPTVENPNLCGLPGDHIELPLSFYETANSGKFGDNAKAMLALWARYRWGAYEEHGYPENDRFPYFYQSSDAETGEPQWLPTGCTNAPNNILNGTYMNIDGTVCNATTATRPGSTCRFVPDKLSNQDVTSSLMYLPWMDTVEHFCDETTHDKTKPTMQNLFCDNKSVMETIKGSPDFKTVTDKKDVVPRLRTRVTKPVDHPALYILFDQGAPAEADQGFFNVAVQKIAKWFSTLDFSTGTIVGVGNFPTTEDNMDVQNVLELGLVGDRVQEFLQGIANRPVLNTKRDFGLAIQQAAGMIQKLQPIRGGAVLIVKTGGASNEQSFPFENEVENTLRAAGVSLYAIEISGTDDMNKNLEALAQSTKGGSVAINSVEDVNSMVDGLLAQLETFLTGSAGPELDEAPLEVFAGMTESGQIYQADLPDGAEEAHFHFVTAEKADISNMFAGIDEASITENVTFTETREYGNGAGGANRYVYTGTLVVMTPPEATTEAATSAPGDARAIVVRSVKFQYTGSAGMLKITATGTAVPKSFDVEVYTSAKDDTVDLAPEAIDNPYVPFAIYTRVTQGGKPVSGAAVTATLENQADLTKTDISLVDDGIGSPDISTGDGIYTGVVVPPADGGYKLSVTVKTASTRTSVMPTGNMRLIPVDQDFGSIEEPVTLPEGISKSASYSSIVQVNNRNNYKQVIGRILDLKVNAPENSNNVEFDFLAPNVVGMTQSPSEYRFYRSQNMEDLINLNLDDPLPGNVNNAFNISKTAVPGDSIRHSQQLTRDQASFYAVAAFDGTSHSTISNIVNVGQTVVPPEPETDDDDGEWLTSTAGIITVVVIVLVCFAGAAVGYKVVEKRRAKKHSDSTTFINSA